MSAVEADTLRNWRDVADAIRGRPVAKITVAESFIPTMVDAITALQQRLAEVEGALEKCFGLACDYTLDERAMRNEVTKIARSALSTEKAQG